MENNFIVRPMTIEDLKIALSWAEAEGWNPGIDDAYNFYAADPGGFLIGELNGEPISCISVVRYPQNFNFIGIYIVKPDWRNQGFGLQTWHEGLKLIPEQPAALDAVLQQVENYRKFGFQPAHSHLRYQGIVSGQISPDVIDIKLVDFEQLCSYDSRYFPSYRSQFLQTWINQPHGKGYAIMSNGNLLGYGVIRKAVDGFKVAPLFAENQEVAEKLFLALVTYAEESHVSIDVPNINQQAITLFESHKMQSVFECVRMYTADKPKVDWKNVFGVTSLEIG